MKQITEDYCSFETAKLLKEKGFDGECSRFYMPSGNGRWKYGHYHDFDISERIDCPTHQMALKWLREVHRKHICVRMRDFPTQYEIEVYDTKTGYLCHADFEHSFNSYEEACEAAIKYCLENLI